MFETAIAGSPPKPAWLAIPCTNCGMAPMERAIALRKIEALARGAEPARRRHA